MKENLALLYTLEQIPEVIKIILEKRKEISDGFVSLFLEKDIKKIYFSGQASGIYLGLILKKFIEIYFRIEVQVTNPAEFLQNERFNVNGVYMPQELCMICPAHSGSTTGPIEMAKKCRQQGIAVVATTYNTESELARLSDVVIYKYSDAEESYIETKGHFASLMCIWICFLEYGIAAGKLSSDVYRDSIAQLIKIAENMPEIIGTTRKWYALRKEILFGTPYIRYVASDEYEGAALEGSLKIAETAHIASVFYETEEFMHRSTTQINENSVIIILSPTGPGYRRNLELRNWAMEYTDKVILITSEKSSEQGPAVLKIPCADAPFFSPMEYMLVLEILAYELCQDLHQSVIKPDNDGASEKLNTHITVG